MAEKDSGYPTLDRALSNPILRAIFTGFVALALSFIVAKVNSIVTKIDDLDIRTTTLEKWQAAHEADYKARAENRAERTERWEKSLERSDARGQKFLETINRLTPSERK